jgi:iron complex transport system ATP-binding protein
MVALRYEEQLGAMIRIHKLGVRKGGTNVIEDVSFEIETGSLTALLGPNGSGKTTLLRTLAGATPFSGTIEIDNVSIRDLDARRRSRLIAYAEQEPAYPADMTVEHYVLLGRAPYFRPFRGPTQRDHELANEALHHCRIDHLAHRKLIALSGGERRRCSLAQALAQTTPVLLLDEPTTALDVGQQQNLLELVDSIRRQRETTVVVALHDLTLTRQYGTDVALLKSGHLMTHGPVETVLTLEALELHYETTLAHLTLDGVTAIVPRRPICPTTHRPM